MQQITPRWEWRAFGRRFREAEARQATLTPEGAPASDKIYLLCAAGGNVKVRNALVDIKILKQVNAQGLEQWMPIMKAAFPLAAAETAQLFDTLGLAGPSRSGARCTLDAFIQQFARQGGAIRAVRVHKQRTQHTVGGCMVELADVTADGKATRTVAVGSEDAGAVTHVVRGLGLGGYANTSYPRGLAALIDRAVRCACNRGRLADRFQSQASDRCD